MKQFFVSAAALLVLASACSDDEPIRNEQPQEETQFPEWYYAGGELGTAYLSTSNALEQPTPAVENAGLYQSFKNGEAIFEKPFMSNNSGVRSGLGPVYIRHLVSTAIPAMAMVSVSKRALSRPTRLETAVCW